MIYLKASGRPWVWNQSAAAPVLVTQVRLWVNGDQIEVRFCAWYFLTINPIHKSKSGCGDLITGQKTHREPFVVLAMIGPATPPLYVRAG